MSRKDDIGRERERRKENSCKRYPKQNTLVLWGEIPSGGYRIKGFWMGLIKTGMRLRSHRDDDQA